MRRSLALGLALVLAGASSAGAQAPSPKVLRVAFDTAETGFDPQATGDVYSEYVNRAIFDPLYRYEPSAAGHRVVPNTAAAMPEISPDGRTWTIRLRPGIDFSDDPAFGGRRRELTAHDYAYSLKRLLDPSMRSPGSGALDGILAGVDDVLAKARAAGRLDYDAPFPAIEAVDRYTLRLRLAFPASALLSDLASNWTSAVAREVVEAYRDGNGWVMERPVGTGRFRLAEWRRGSRIVLEARRGDQAWRDARGGAAAGVAVDRVEVSVIEEAQSRLLAFEAGDLDYVQVPATLAGSVLDAGGKLKPAFAAKGVVLHRHLEPAVTYTYFNMEDAVVGGYTPDRVALRRAIAMAYDVGEDARVLRQGQAVAATQLIPPGVGGHDPAFRSRPPFDPAAARELLERFGYRDRDGDGYRERPDGRALTLTLSSPPTAVNRGSDELWQRSLKAVGLRIAFNKQKWPDLLKAGRLGQLQMFSLGWRAPAPEGIMILDTLYGPFAGNANQSRFRLAAFDALYEQARAMPNGPERDRVLRQASGVVATHAPYVLGVNRYENLLVQRWVANYRYDPFDAHPWARLDLDPKRRAAARR